jgi:signal transduction histidine kinase
LFRFLNRLKREHSSSYYFLIISIIGWTIFSYHFLLFSLPIDTLLIYALFALFISLTEYYPIPVWKGFSALSFPLIYTLELLYGISVAVITYGVIMLIVNILQQRPLRVSFFNPLQLVISIYGASIFTSWLMSIDFLTDRSELEFQIIRLFLFVFFFYLLNQVIVDFYLWVRPKRYSWSEWRIKTGQETIIALFSFLYSGLMLVLGSQNRGTVDFFSYLFFFSPLVAFSFISSGIIRLQKERNRLKALFSITKELNQVLPSDDWIQTIKARFPDFLEIEAGALLIKEDDGWKLKFQSGNIQKNLSINQLSTDLDQMNETYYYRAPAKGNKRFFSPFNTPIKSAVFSPLTVENQTVGMLIVGRSRSHSFRTEEVQSIATLANQLAVMTKTRMLIKEREKRILLEERNRLAREIHDGIAQALAGAVMKLDSSTRLYNKDPNKAYRLMEESVEKLRYSLKEVKESIYALRPEPTDRVGLVYALQDKIESLQNEHGIQIDFRERGKRGKLDPLIEKVIFNTVTESLQNVVKHADASKVDILLGYGSDRILLKVKDNGKGFSLYEALIKARHEPHYGILNMNEQADQLGASLQINSSSGKGTEIVLIISNKEIEGGAS